MHENIDRQTYSTGRSKQLLTPFLAVGLVTVITSCNHHPVPAVPTVQEVQKGQEAQEVKKGQASIAEPRENTIHYEGRLVSLDKLDTRYYHLILTDSGSHTDTFLTLMPIDSAETSMLRKTGNNIVIEYHNHYNPVHKDTEKVVQTMTPIYNFNTR